MIVGWQFSTSLRTDLALDAVDMGWPAVRRARREVLGLVHHYSEDPVKEMAGTNQPSTTANQWNVSAARPGNHPRSDAGGAPSAQDLRPPPVDRGLASIFRLAD